MRRRRLSLLVSLVALTSVVAACRTSPPLRTGAQQPPNPSGCFVQVWDLPNRGGAVSFLNGPARFERMTTLPGRESWANRIRSVHVGPLARVTAWTEERYAGRQWRPTDSNYEAMPAGFDREIESLEILCVASPTR